VFRSFKRKKKEKKGPTRKGPISVFSTHCSREKNLLIPAAAGSFSLDATSSLLATRRRLGRRGDSFRHVLSFCGVSCMYEEFTKKKKISLDASSGLLATCRRLGHRGDSSAMCSAFVARVVCYEEFTTTKKKLVCVCAARMHSSFSAIALLIPSRTTRQWGRAGAGARATGHPGLLCICTSV